MLAMNYVLKIQEVISELADRGGLLEKCHQLPSLQYKIILIGYLEAFTLGTCKICRPIL